MTPRYPCPNPICTHEFDPAELAGADSVTCPRCGMTIQLRAPAPPPAIPVASPPLAGSVPMARPVGSVPMATVPMARAVPPATGVPMAAPVAPPIGPQAFQTLSPSGAAASAAQAPMDLSMPVVRKKALPRSRDWLTYSLLLGGFLLLVAFGVAGALVGFGTFGKKGLGSGSGYKNGDYNFAFDPKVAGWEENSGMKNKMGVSQLVLSRAEPAGYFALDVIDYKDHNPTPRELDVEARRRLKDLFTKNLETEPGADAQPKTGDKVAGQPTYRIAFAGETPEESFSGEVQFFGNQGLGYWIFTWAPSAAAKELTGQFAEMKKTFALLGERAAWKQTQSQSTPFDGNKIKGYRVVDTTGRWKLDDDPEAQDPAADIALNARDPSKPKVATLGANLVVMSLPSGKDPVEQTKEHILKMHERDGFPGSKIFDAYSAGEGPKDQVGEAKGHLLRWRISNGGGRERFAVVGIVPRSSDVLVLYGECDYARRSNWEVQLVQIVESLQVKE